MANGHVEIHDPFTNGPKSSVARGNEDEDDEASGMEDTVEFRFMMVYAKRRRAKDDGLEHLSGTPSPQVPLRGYDVDSLTEKKKKKKRRRRMKGWKRLFSCVRPRTSDDEPEPAECGGDGDGFRHFPSEIVKDTDELEAAALHLTEITDEIPFVTSGLQTDSPDDNVERLIGLLLREAGDRLDEQELRDVSLAREIFWNYSLFKTVINELLKRMGLSSPDPEAPGPRASPRTQIAVTCEATSRLTALDTMPMNRLFGYGAKFLSENYSSWIQEQGGYEAAFKSDDEDEVH